MKQIIKTVFTKEEVIDIISSLLEYPDVVTDAMNNENTDYSASDLFDYGTANLNFKPTGLDYIAAERQKQIDKHGFTAEHHVVNSEKWYSKNQMQMAAIYLLEPWTKSETFRTNIPLNWDRDWFTDLNSRDEKERIIIAGALIAAELDRLNLMEEMLQKSKPQP